MLLFNLCLTSLISFVAAAPSSLFDVKTAVKIVNKCPKTIQVGQLGDTLLEENQPITLASGKSKTYTIYGRWSGRFWAREDCRGSACQIAGAAFPASLAEFTFHTADGQDFYDVSFVDGYNLPISIKPVQPESVDPNNRYWCGAPACQNIPSCPTELQLTVDGRYIGCQSACSKFGTPEYCCSGEYSTPDKCKINQYASRVKSKCPEAYSFAYDDSSSLYQCKATGYVITWCP